MRIASSKGVALKGFRKGKVPRPVLEQVYGQRVNAEVAYELVRESFFKANRSTTSRRSPSRASRRPPRSRRASRSRSPRSSKCAAKSSRRTTRASRSAPQAEHSRDRGRGGARAAAPRAHRAASDRGSRDHGAGDIVGLSITGTIGEHEINQPQFAVDLDDEEREPLPGLRQALIGIPLDTKDKKLEITVPDDYKDETLKGRKADLTFTILEARAKDVPELDDEFAKDTGKADTLDGLRAALRKELEDKEQEVIDREAREGVLRELIKKNQIPVASSLVDRAVEMQYQRLRQMLGMKPERGTRRSTDDLRDKMRPAGADEVRGQLLLEAIADKENIAVTDEEINKHVEETAKARNIAPAKLRAEWQRDGRLDNVTYSLRQEKVLKFLVDNAKITEVEKLSQQGTPLPEGPSHGEEGHVHGPDCDHDH